MAYRIESVPFRDVYKCLVDKAVRKGRTQEEVNQLICWLTGYDADGLAAQLSAGADHRAFYGEAPNIHPLADQIKGSVCGVKLAEITDPLMLNIRRLDKLVDDLAKGKPLAKLLPGSDVLPAPAHAAVNPIDAYIAAQPEDRQERLQWLRALIRSEFPEATEKISWGMPTFWQGMNLVHFAMAKQHIGLYPGPDTIVAFSDALQGYHTSKGAIQLPLSQPMDEKLLRTMMQWIRQHAAEVMAAKQAKKAASRKKA